MAEVDDPAVDLGAAATVADVGMHGIGEVQGRGALHQIEQLPARSEDENPIAEQFVLQ